MLWTYVLVDLSEGNILVWMFVHCYIDLLIFLLHVFQYIVLHFQLMNALKNLRIIHFIFKNPIYSCIPIFSLTCLSSVFLSLCLWGLEYSGCIIWREVRRHPKRGDLVGWGCRIHHQYLFRGVRPPPNECPGYDTKQSDSEAPVLELWRMWITPSLPLLPGSPWPRVVASDWLPSTVWPFNCVQANDILSWMVSVTWQ